MTDTNLVTDFIPFTEDEIEALLMGLTYVNAYYRMPPHDPTPGMTAAAKLGKAIDKEREPKSTEELTDIVTGLIAGSSA